MAPEAPSNSSGSVIINRSKKRETASLWWCFTFNNYTEDNIEHILSWFNGSNHSYIFQEEIGKESTPHLQGTVRFTSKCRPIENNKHINGMIWGKTRSVSHATNYCQKDETRSGRRWSNIPEPRELELIKESMFLIWQQNLYSILKGRPHNRAIYWYWEPIGHCGKTQYCKFICATMNAILVGGKSNDTKHGIVEYHKNNHMYPDICIVNITRSQEDHINYEAIEMVKDGIFFSGKYESKMVIFNSPHVVVFANKPPDTTKMSKDRWVVTEITQYPCY